MRKFQISKFKKNIIAYAIFKPIGEGYDIMYICVKKDFRRRGYGKKILQNFLDFCKKPIFLEVRKSNFPAISLYNSIGFKQISERKKYYHDGEDAWVFFKNQ